MRARVAAKVLLGLLGSSLLIPGLAVTGWALSTSLPYLLGKACSMAAFGLLALPVTLPMIVGGALLLIAARRV